MLDCGDAHEDFGAHALPDDERPAAARRGKKPFTDPTLRVFTKTTPIPDTFPGASYFRAAGLGTYHAVFNLSPDEVAAAEKFVGRDVLQKLSALRLAR